MIWYKKTLGEIYAIEGGSVQTGPFGSQLHESDYKEFGVPVIMPKDIKNDKLDLTNIAHISDEDAKRLSQHIVKVGDIICPRRGEIGKRIIIEEENVGAFCGTGCIRLRGTGLELNQRFFFYFLQQPNVVNWIENQAVGSTMMNLNTSIIKSIPVKYPPLPIQQKIASILSAYDELIENNKQRIKLLEEMAQEIYKEWFVRLRFPNYENTEFVDGLPLGWEKVKLRNCFEHYIGGGWGEDSPNGKNELPAHVIRGTDIPNARVGNLNYDVLRYHSSSNLLSRRLIANDIVFEVSGGTETQSLGRSLLITQSLLDRFDEDLICASFCKLVRVKRGYVSGYFIYLLLNRLYKTGEIMLFQVQSTGISNYQFEEFIDKQKAIIPSKEIQDKFDNLIQPMFDEIQLLGSKNQLLQQTRDLLLPRLISGKLSVAGLLENKVYKMGENEECLSMAAEDGI